VTHGHPERRGWPGGKRRACPERSEGISSCTDVGDRRQHQCSWRSFLPSVVRMTGMLDGCSLGCPSLSSLRIRRHRRESVAPAGADSTDGIVRIPALTGGATEVASLRCCSATTSAICCQSPKSAGPCLMEQGTWRRHPCLRRAKRANPLVGFVRRAGRDACPTYPRHRRPSFCFGVLVAGRTAGGACNLQFVILQSRLIPSAASATPLAISHARFTAGCTK